MNDQHQTVQKLLSERRPTEALPLARELTKSLPSDGNAWFLLASALRSLGELQEAQKAINQALIAQPFHPAFHAFRGELHLDQRQYPDAEAALKQAIAAKSDFAPALHALGILQMDTNRPVEAETSFRLALQAQPKNAIYLNNLGASLLTQGKDLAALAAFENALQLAPDYDAARFSAIRLLVKIGRDDQATQQIQQLLASQPEHAELHYLLGKLLHRNASFQEAFHHLLKASRLAPINAAIIQGLADFTWEQGDEVAARSLLGLANQAKPTIETAIRHELMLPFVYSGNQHLNESRAQYADGLARLNASLRDALPSATTIDSFQHSNFLLAYQGKDDKALQRKYGEILEHVVKETKPRSCKINLRSHKRRIGFVSNHLYDCTVGRYFGSWIKSPEMLQFERYIYNGTAHHDSHTSALLKSATAYRNTFALPPSRISELIIEDEIDILIFPELGMHPQTFPLGALRSAPIQVAAWGHPVTTGLSEIDYFLSPESMEVENASSHYTEKLKLLPGLGTNYEPDIPPQGVNRAELGLDERAHLYLIPQSIYKIHPDNDAVYCRILQLDPEATLVFFHSNRHRVACSRFRSRLRDALQHHELSIDRALFIEQCDHGTFLSINQSCDVMVDTLHWSGGNTSLDAICAGLPIVTCPGEFMRGRQSAAMLRLLGLEDLVTSTPEQLAEKAVHIATSSELRAHYSETMGARRGNLFGQTDAVTALANFLGTVTV